MSETRLPNKWLAASAMFFTASVGALAISVDNYVEVRTEVASGGGVLNRQPTAQETFLADKLRESVTDRETRIDCTKSLPNDDDNDGYLEYAFVLRGMYDDPIPVLHVAQELCDDITEYAETVKTGRFTLDLHAAQYTLVHEAQHVEYRSNDEAFVSCAAIQKVTKFAKALGADKESQFIVYHQAASIYDAQPPEYLSPKCRDGGKYDLDPGHSGQYFPAQ